MNTHEQMNLLVETLEVENNGFQTNIRELKAKIEKNCDVIDFLKARLGAGSVETATQPTQTLEQVDLDNETAEQILEFGEESQSGKNRFQGMETREIALTLLRESNKRTMHTDEILRLAEAEGVEIKTGTLRSTLSTKPEFKSFGKSMWGLVSSSTSKYKTYNTTLIKGGMKVSRTSAEVAPITEALLKPSEAELVPTKVQCIELILHKAPRPLKVDEIVEQLHRAGRPISGPDLPAQRSNVWTALTRDRDKHKFRRSDRGLWTVNRSAQNQLGVFDFENEDEEVTQGIEEPLGNPTA